jgi:hypothetical protein
VKVGLIVRAIKTGLGHQSWEIWRHLHPAVTIVVDHGGPPQPWYGDALIIPWQPRQPLPGAFELLATCDVVLSVETFYDWSLPERLAAVGVPTVLIANPELYDGHWTSHVWTHTSWLRRDGWRLIPMPCPVDRYPTVQPLISPVRMVHPTSVAMADRNGSAVVRRASRLFSDPVDLIGPPAGMIDDYWQRDPGYALSLIPRRYGGLCLPALEAMSAGTPVVMPDCSPNQDWPTIPVAAVSSGKLRTKGGSVPLHDVTPQNLARTVKPWLADPERLEAKRVEVRGWAEANSWEVLGPVWLAALEDAAT